MNEVRRNGDSRPMIRPAGNICEENGGVLLRLEMPGVRKEDIDIRVDGSELLITGKRFEEKPNGTYLLRERNVGDYHKTYTIDETIDRDRIRASMEEGVLTIRLELKEAEKPRKISIQAG